ncbi:MAG: hypothetical protein IPJ87_02255 [Flavobacteriales bacterium]|nr:hypothetical protein [Flavobacteriales bacterium]MBK7940695.1 hypothetical protein [Flavobacteriales bacterium]MBK9700888.1 hypothetical protein [Flavobacteriales bacterium]
MDLREDRERLERILLGQEALVNEVRTWLDEEDTADAMVEAAIRSSGDDRMNTLRGLSPARIFGRGAIRDLCVRYRLRFLPSALYKAEIPRQALGAVRALEAGTGQVLRGYHILAPASRFRLCDADADPLLFVRIGPDRYYLIHRWGSDLSPWRAMVHWPLRTPLHLGVTVVIAALMLAAAIPTGWITRVPMAGWWCAHRLLFVFWSTVVVAAFTVQAWFAFFGRFSREAWNSRTFN